MSSAPLCRLLIFACLPVLIFTSCKTSKNLAYFKDLPETEVVSKIATSAYQPLKLQADDEVQVTISSTSPEASQFFNMMSSTPLTTVAGAGLLGNANPSSSTGQNFMNLYRVSSGGAITLPVLNDIAVAGMTTDELKAAIKTKLIPYLKDAVVTVRLTNFKVTVIGEVSRPVVVPVNGQTINVLEAVGAAGDMTAFGVRKNVKVIRRQPNGNTEIAVLNFNKADVLQSPYFQLRQNDIVYIQPNKNKSLASSQTGLWVSIITSIASITAIILTRRY